MKMTLERNLSALILFVLLATSVFAQNKPLSDLSGGKYPALSSVLGEISYHPEVLNRLANPTLVYADKKWLTEHGYAIPGNEKEFEKQILEALAFAAKVKGEKNSDYMNEEKTFYSDYYGGEGIGANRGSGRAASKGEIQIKGSGQTHMVHYSEKTDAEHSSGVAGLYEGIMETLGSQIANNELPFGANRVIALIATGTTTSEKEPRVLIVREDPLRPAHFIVNEYSKQLKREQARIKFVLSNIGKALPLPEGKTYSSEAEKIRAGLLESIDRHAKVAAYSYANHFLHSAFSPSNEVISGAALDFGAFMALDGYPRAGRPDDKELNGDTRAVENVIKEFVNSLRKDLPERVASQLPTIRESIDLLKERYTEHLRYEMTLLTGAPPELAKEAQKSSQVRKFSDLLIWMSQQGNTKEFDALNESLVRTDTYRLERILVKMAQTFASTKSYAATEKGLNETLTLEVPDSKVRTRLINGYLQMLRELQSRAEAQKISLADLQMYMGFASKIRNRKTPALMVGYDDVERVDWVTLIEEFKSSKNPAKIRAALQQTIDGNRRTFRDAKPMTLVLKEKNTGRDRFERDVFDLRSGTVQIETKSLGDLVNTLVNPKSGAPMCSKVHLRH